MIESKKYHDIIKQNGKVYARIWVEDGSLRIILMQYSPDIEILLDQKAIPQFADILQKIRNEMIAGSTGND